MYFVLTPPPPPTPQVNACKLKSLGSIQEIEDKKERPPTQPDHNDEVFETVNNNKGLNENELSVLSMSDIVLQ